MTTTVALHCRQHDFMSPRSYAQSQMTSRSSLLQSAPGVRTRATAERDPRSSTRRDHLLAPLGRAHELWDQLLELALLGAGE